MKTVPFYRPIFSIVFLCLILVLITPPPAQADLPNALKSIQFDWVCVTDADLVEAYAPLAAHRESQGLRSLVLSLDEVMLWSPAGEDTMATLRWLSGVAVNQWGAEYLVLGGSHALLPAPVHRFVYGGNNYDYPTDACYACLDGVWDTDGDGVVAEAEDDAAEPTVHLSVGRLPADDVPSVENVVAKIIAYEGRPVHSAANALFATSHLRWMWQPGEFSLGINTATALINHALSVDPNLNVSRLFESLQDGTPDPSPLTVEALVDSLGGRSHDLVHMQFLGEADIWAFGDGRVIQPEDFAPLADCGHSFLLTMLAASVGDTRGQSVLSSLLALSDGGLAGAIVPSGVCYNSALVPFQKDLWTHLVDGASSRLGDAFRAALDDFVTTGLFEPDYRKHTYWYQTLLGDPATLLRPQSSHVNAVPSMPIPLRVTAVPNPFNPETEIRFHVPQGDGSLQPVRVEIFNLQGRRVTTLLEQNLSAGPHAVVWRDGSGSGLYFARVSVANQQVAVKLMLVE